MKFGNEFHLNAPSAAEEIAKIPSLERLPVDYVSFMRKANGGHGTVGNEHLIVFPSGDIVGINEAAAIERFAPGLLIFASNGGGQSYAFDLRYDKVVIVRFFDMDLGDEEPIRCADSFEEFIDFLTKKSM